jgi:SAM-dependent methyltransferase
MSRDYSTITEVGGEKVTRDQVNRAYSRYVFASELAAGKEVLEIACGSGFGLGLISNAARRVVAGDYTASLVQLVRRQYETRIPVLQLDAQRLPFENASFDLILLFEAIYYLLDAADFVRESYRTLRPGGKLIIVSANIEWADFNPSPFSTRYYSGSELLRLLEVGGFSGDLLAAFPASARTWSQKLTGMLKRTAIACGLMPKTMNGKRWLKRVFFGPLTDLPRELKKGDGTYEAPQPVSRGPVDGFKVLYAVGTKTG